MRVLARRLSDLRRKLLRRERMLVNVTAEGQWVATLQQRIGALLPRFQRDGESGSEGRFGEERSAAAYAELGEPVDWEGLEIPAAVGYAALALPGAYFGEDAHALQVLIAHILKTDYLWEKIRMNGGAYGAGASAHGLEGLFSFFSYRDPSAADSLEVFLRGLEQIAAGRFTENDLEQAVISVVGHDLRPHSPGEKSLIGLRRTLLGITDNIRREKRRTLLAAGRGNLQEEAQALTETAEKAVRVLLASRDTVEEAVGRYPQARSRRVRVSM
jgi:Zn-dependent M16 (insulinase) family peptidase